MKKVTIQIRLNEEEKELIKKIAEYNKITITELILKEVLKK